MSDPVLTTATPVQCAHGGRAATVSSVTRVRVAGTPVLVAGDPVTVAGCPLPTPPNGPGPCVSAQFTSASARVRAQGRAVLLHSSTSVSAPAGTPLVVGVGQPRVRGV